MLTNRASQARLNKAAERRTYLGKVKAIDLDAMRKAVGRQAPQDKAIIEHILAGAAWTAGQMKQSGLAATALCPLCGKEEKDITHGLWYCQAVKDKMKEESMTCHIDVADLPKCLQVGIPPIDEYKFLQDLLAAQRSSTQCPNKR